MAEERMLNDEILLALIKDNSGGGGGGTTDYSDLSNKPQINSVTLSGNMSASDLELATAAEVEGKQDALTAGANINMTGDVVKAGVVEVVEPDMTVYGNSTESGSKTYTIETTGVYEIFYCLSLQSTVSVTLPNDANVLFESDLTVSSHPVKHIVAELHEGDTVTIAQTPNQWNAVVSGVLKLDAISVVNVAHTGSIADNTITYTLPNDNKYYLVVGACVGKPTGNNAVDSTSGGTPEITRTLTGSGVRFRSVVVKGSDSPSFSFYGYDGGVASIIAFEIEFEEGNWDYNLATKNYVDTALAGKQDTLTFDDTPTDNSNNPVKSNGVYDALALKQDKTDNTLQTTSKTVVGAVNELKSGFTNYENQNDLNLETPTRKNLISMTVDAIKAANTIGIWSGDSYTLNGVTMAIQKDNDGNVEGVKLTGINTLGSVFYLYICNFTCKAGQKYYMNGCPEGGSISTYILSISGSYPDIGSGSTIVPFSADTIVSVRITIGNGYDFGSGGKIFKPMIRPSFITDATFAHYVPSVESRIEAVESGLSSLGASANLSNWNDYPDFNGKYIIIGKLCIFNLSVTKSDSSWNLAGIASQQAAIDNTAVAYDAVNQKRIFAKNTTRAIVLQLQTTDTYTNPTNVSGCIVLA